jgi:hypothetical protein
MTEETHANRQSGPALEAMHQFILWLIPTVEKFPRSQKFLLGDRIQAGALDVLERLIEATYTRSRDGLLRDANTGIETRRFLVRIASDCAASTCAATSIQPAHSTKWEGSWEAG